jgi:hypothetical protein
MENLTNAEWKQLIQSVFPGDLDGDRLAFLVDVPLKPGDDTPGWKERRHIVDEWLHQLQEVGKEVGLSDVKVLAYPAVRSNNANLPGSLCRLDPKAGIPDTAEELSSCGEKSSLESAFRVFSLFFAPTQYSATAPLKLGARKYGFRAATMPGFSADMIPALKIDYGRVNERVAVLKERLDEAENANITFTVDGRETENLFFDLRYRQAHASGGWFPEEGMAGNLPSGETYIVPYEGEKEEDSRTEGRLPVQFGDEVVVYIIRRNRARSVEGEGPKAKEERLRLAQEPAYGNMAELGFGVLADFGLKPIGQVLLDEKLGFHIAFGRSDHFDGFVGPQQFSSEEAVVHIDRIYIPEVQPRITVKSIVLTYPSGQEQMLMEKGLYCIF